MQRLYSVGILVFALGLVGFGVACQPQAPPDTRAADEQAIRNMSQEWLKAAQAKDVEGMVAAFADDASALPPNAPIATGKEAIRKVWSEMVENPGFSVSTQVNKVEVSRASDLAYSHGTYELTLSDPQGKPVTDRGKWVAVWEKQPDGSWKCIADIWNSDQPPAGAR